MCLALALTIFLSAVPVSAETVTAESTSGAAATATTAVSTNASYAAPLGADAQISTGWYFLQPLCATSSLLNVKNSSKKDKANINIAKSTYKNGQLFYIQSLGSGLYSIKNKRSKKVLTVKDGSTKSKANVYQYTWSNLDSQKFYITKRGSRYVFQNVLSKNVLTVAGNAKSTGNVRMQPYTKAKGQRWKLISYSDIFPEKAVSTRKWNGGSDYTILANIIAAVESGGHIYGNLVYDAYDEPYANSPNEYTITIGWAQCYGPEASELLNRIYNLDKTAFNKIDKVLPKKQRIKKYLSKNITALHWKPNKKQKAVIKKLLRSSAGKKAQMQQFTAYMKNFVKDCKNSYTDNAWAVVMYCEIRHLGGKGAVNRIFKRCNGNYSLESIKAALKKDQSDSSSRYQVGDTFYNSRHNTVMIFLQKYMK